MKYLTTILVTTVLVLASCKNDDDNPTPFSDQEIVEQTVSEYFSALNSENIEACIASFSTDAILIQDDVPRVSGESAISNVYNFLLGSETGQLNATFDVATEFISTQVDGDLAAVLTYSNGTSTFNGLPANQANSELFVLRKVAAEWKIAVYLFNQPNLGLCGTGGETFLPEIGRSTPDGEIEQVIADYFTALNNEDIEGAVTLFAEDARLIQDDAPRATGINEISNTYDFLLGTGLDQLNVTFDLQAGFINTQVAGNIATVLTYSTGDSIISGFPADQENSELFVLKRIDGEWKIFIYIFNQPLPPLPPNCI